MCLRFVFLLIMRLTEWLRLSCRGETWKTAEILIMRHQLAVLQRRQPRPAAPEPWVQRPVATKAANLVSTPTDNFCLGTLNGSAWQPL